MGGGPGEGRAPLRFGLGAPVFAIEEILRAARFADESGFDGFWVPEHLIRRGDRGLALEPLTILAAVARETRRFHLGTYVRGIQRRHPAMLAFLAASLDHLSGGRLVLGLGSGAGEMDRALGIPDGDSVARLPEYVEVLRRLWREERPTYAGTFYQLGGGTLLVHPLQDPLPIWIAVQGPKGMAVAGAAADGWVSNWIYTPEGFGRALAAVRRNAVAAGRDPAGIVGLFEAGVAVAETQAEAEQHGVPGFQAKLLKIGGGYAYGYRQLQALGYAGPPPTALDQIPDAVARACSILGTPDRVIQRIEGGPPFVSAALPWRRRGARTLPMGSDRVRLPRCCTGLPLPRIVRRRALGIPGPPPSLSPPPGARDRNRDDPSPWPGDG